MNALVISLDKPASAAPATLLMEGNATAVCSATAAAQLELGALEGGQDTTAIIALQAGRPQTDATIALWGSSVRIAAAVITKEPACYRTHTNALTDCAGMDRAARAWNTSTAPTAAINAIYASGTPLATMALGAPAGANARMGGLGLRATL